MNNTFLLIVSIILAVATFFAYEYKVGKVARPIYIQPEQPLIVSPLSNLPPEHPALQTIRAINDRNAQVRNVYYENVAMKIKEKMTVTLTAFLAYEKDKKFRMITSSFVGQETDVGSNEHIFWFWSRRMDPPILYFAKHEDTSRSKLRAPFHPDWMREGLGLDQIKIDGATFEQDGSRWKVFEKRVSASGKPVVKMTLIDNEKILGHYLYNNQGQLISSIEAKDFYRNGHIVPRVFLMTWAEENITVEWTMSAPRINGNINSALWEKPKMRREQDLATR